MTPARAHSYCVRGLGARAPSPLVGEGWGGGWLDEALASRPTPTPTPDPSPQGGGEKEARGEGDEIARIGFGVFGNARARCLPLTLPLSTGLSGRPSYSSIPPRSRTQAA